MIRMKKAESVPEIVVGAYIKNDSDEFLFVKSRYEKNVWTVPGGHVERGERITDALRRNVSEETGLIVNPTRLLGILEKISKNKPGKDKTHFIFLDFLCEISQKHLKPRTSEVKNHMWAKRSRLKRIKVDKYTRHTLKMLKLEGVYEPYISTVLENRLLNK